MNFTVYPFCSNYTYSENRYSIYNNFIPPYMCTQIITQAAEQHNKGQTPFIL